MTPSRAPALGIALVVAILGAMLASAGCGEERAARATFNRGVEALERRDFEAAAKLLLEARSEAGLDPELRFRAAFDLGVAYAAHADQVRSGAEPDLAKAHELASQALSWFGDAARQRPEDADAVKNRNILRARVQALADELRRGAGKLEARIDAVIHEQRAVLDGARAAWLAIQRSGGADPLAQRDELARLAGAERGIVAEVGAISDLAADELDAIGKRAEDQRSQEEQVRAIQLKALDIYLLEARARIAEARRKLQDLAAEAAVERAEAAMVALKRAREQLLDPITVLRVVARDQLELARDTAAGSAPRALSLDAQAGSAAPASGRPTPSRAAAAAEGGPAPWLAPGALAARQGSLRDRLAEVRGRLDAAVAAARTAPAAPSAAPPGSGAAPPGPATAAGGTPLTPVPPAAPAPGAPGPVAGTGSAAAVAGAPGPVAGTGSAAAAAGAPAAASAPPLSPEQRQLIARVEIALPDLATAQRAMEAAQRALADAQLPVALRHEQEALAALTRAIERFADLRQTIELAHAEQAQVSALLSAQGAQLPAAERATAAREGIARNVARAARIGELIAEAAAAVAGKQQELAAQAPRAPGSGTSALPGSGSAAGPGSGSAAGPGAGSAGPAPTPDPAQAQAAEARRALEAEQQKLARAEALRGELAAALDRLVRALGAAPDRGAPDAPAAEARQKIDELRKLFFSVIEHLQQLLRDQGDTRDRTAEIHASGPADRGARVGAVVAPQEQHGALADAIVEALAAQADAAGKQPASGTGGPPAKALAEAAEEVRKARRAMADAIAGAIKVRDAQGASESLEPTLTAQGTAITHLEAALRLLQPPKPQQQQEQQQQEPQQQDPQQQDPQQQQRGGQAARDQDAQQQRKRQQREAGKDIVEKDW
jgi:hypothetical protein